MLGNKTDILLINTSEVSLKELCHVVLIIGKIRARGGGGGCAKVVRDYLIFVQREGETLHERTDLTVSH